MKSLKSENRGGFSSRNSRIAGRKSTQKFDSDNGVFRKKSDRGAISLTCEPLETRRLLSGSLAAPTHAAPGGVETAIQLSDGSIMVNGEGGGGAPQSAW